MNNKKPSKRAIRYAKETKLGRFLCRLAGEENGQAMMEYVIIAVCIAAAVALGAYFFGATILDFFGIASKSTAGLHVEAGDDAVAVQQNIVNDRIAPAKANADKFSDSPTPGPDGHQ